MTVTSSLKGSAVNNNDTFHKEARNKGSGMFESCFAQGLDLSEFKTQSSSRKPNAASELLLLKAKESKQAAQEAQEEVSLAHNAAMRAKEQVERISLKKAEMEGRDWKMNAFSSIPSGDSASFTGALVGAIADMHGRDDHGAKKTQKRNFATSTCGVKGKNVRKGATGKKMCNRRDNVKQPLRHSSKSSGKNVVKKTRKKSKY
mmetsp:Transcript_32874/g.48215  ORF Transcript_32874/g.48215 Transcript_32874/m.48215 type:complete len:203 (+) Transcript_32874:331-939(+)|eukprot:CAMPEP_0195514994 /NCGR_PEP_ID=MMETSP0794_2-20130614/6220_1 /TAXON_ID=515487 /ORGANISM="Stephanopyxis turris, Strain CCMP 815" /LENGTH=202 /DNA_ID=CAMNT_0040643369 /DNA_START=271 /DNA_END=879 /DNA_ORIENTATION=+